MHTKAFLIRIEEREHNVGNNSWQIDALKNFKNEVGGVFERYAATYSIDRGPYSEQYLENLRELRELYCREQELHEGDYVEWKPGLKNKKRPAYYQPGIVMEVLPEPVFDKELSSGSAYFREKLDVVIGFIDDDNDFVTYYFDSRRFMPLRVNMQNPCDGGGHVERD